MVTISGRAGGSRIQAGGKLTAGRVDRAAGLWFVVGTRFAAGAWLRFMAGTPLFQFPDAQQPLHRAGELIQRIGAALDDDHAIRQFLELEFGDP